VSHYLNGGDWRIIAEFTEVESGRRADRPELERALAAARVHRVPLVVAKVDRLTRSVGFLSRLLAAGVDVRFADLPTLEGPTGRLGGNRGVVLTKAARKAGRDVQTARATARAADLAPVLKELQRSGIVSLGGIARVLTERGIPTARGGNEWTAMQVARIMARLPTPK
jgi:hypothetical protein